MKNKKPAIRFKGFSEEWEEKKFAHIIYNLSGGASIRPEDYQEKGIRTIPKGAVNSTGVADLLGSKFVSTEFFERNSSSRVSTNDLVTSLRDLVPSAPNMGRIVRIEGVQEFFLMPQGVYKIEVYNNINEDFVITYSNSDRYRKIITTEKSGSTQVHIRNGEFLNIDISIPTLSEQTQIGNFFKNLDNLISLHQRKYEKLGILKKAMLEKMFPKNGADVPEIRFKGFYGAWEEKTLEEGALKIGDGLHGTPQYVNNGGVYFINGNNLISGTICINDDTKQVSTYEQSKDDKTLNNNTILMSINGTIGNLAFYQGEKVMLGKSVAYLTLKEYEKKFIYAYLQTPFIQNYYMNELTGSTIKNLGLKAIRETRLLIPKREEQEKIGNYFKNLDKLLTLHHGELEKLQHLKKALLEKMFV